MGMKIYRTGRITAPIAPNGVVYGSQKSTEMKTYRRRKTPTTPPNNVVHALHESMAMKTYRKRKTNVFKIGSDRPVEPQTDLASSPVQLKTKRIN